MSLNGLVAHVKRLLFELGSEDVGQPKGDSEVNAMIYESLKQPCFIGPGVLKSLSMFDSSNRKRLMRKTLAATGPDGKTKYICSPYHPYANALSYVLQNTNLHSFKGGI